MHSIDYREKFNDNLSKDLPRIPRVKKIEDFTIFSRSGKDLANLHINYDQVEKYPIKINLSNLESKDFHVEKMRFGRIDNKIDKSIVIYNHKITLVGVPSEAYTYIVNGKSALEWVMERQSVVVHKDSEIINDANLWAKETVKNAAYPLELFLRIITVSLETMKIVKALPRLDI